MVLVPFPYSDRQAEKRRPALVVARPEVGYEAAIYWLAMITSARASAWRGDIPIPDVAQAGLTTPCLVRSAKMVSLERVRIVRAIGFASPSVLEQVRATMRAELGEHRPA